jgi:ribonuclease VapC
VTELYLLDTSAILTFTDAEEGADEVEQLLKRAKAGQCQLVGCSISLMEIFYLALREQGEDRAAKLIALIKSWPISWVNPDEKLLLQAGKLKASHHLSVADALIAAAAKLHRATLVHKDPELEALGSEIQLLSLPFKVKR